VLFSSDTEYEVFVKILPSVDIHKSFLKSPTLILNIININFTKCKKIYFINIKKFKKYYITVVITILKSSETISVGFPERKTLS